MKTIFVKKCGSIYIFTVLHKILLPCEEKPIGKAQDKKDNAVHRVQKGCPPSRKQAAASGLGDVLSALMTIRTNRSYLPFVNGHIYHIFVLIQAVPLKEIFLFDPLHFLNGILRNIIF